MSERRIFASLTRISDLEQRPFAVEPLAREEWATRDYVVVHVDRRPRGLNTVELTSGRIAEVWRDAHVVGALGERYATLEAVGSWRSVEADGRIDLMTAAGLLGRVTSLSTTLPPVLDTLYEGHVTRDGVKVTMDDFWSPREAPRHEVPTVLVIGTSMSAGKTTTAKVLIRLLKRAGLRVVGAKLTGAGRYRDVLGMSDAGADAVFDFVDVGLPSTILASEEFRPRLRTLLAKIADARPEVVVVEAGASPLEPYNGQVVLEELGESIRCIALCASDPYAVVGVMQAFERRPDLIAGLATSTSAGVELVERLSGIAAVNVLDPKERPALAAILEKCLGASMQER